MAPQTRTEVVVTGGAGSIARPRAEHGAAAPTSAGLAPARWAGAPARLARMDRLSALALVVCDACLLDAGFAPDDARFDGERLALVLGTAYGCHDTNEEYYRGLLAHGASGASPRLFAYTLPSSAVGEIGIHYRVRGPATTLASGLAAGADALGEALRQLRSGRADRALAIAADVATPLLARLVANGLTIADSAAALLLERAEHAAERGAIVRARVLGAARGYAGGDRRAAVEDAIRRALDDAALAPAAITRVVGAPEDAAATRALGVSAGAETPAPEALAAAPLVAAARWLAAPDGNLLIVAGDPAGAGSAVVLAR
ncbi:MAG TPA: beta-ketoacyl synthase N-terminal-like domain-containing protein [Polyangia bacterium]|nr:beta-ketoacyl synthase N-terminal-like domain-containing protein [Polyangia bacterium]